MKPLNADQKEAILDFCLLNNFSVRESFKWFFESFELKNKKWNNKEDVYVKEKTIERRSSQAL